ncbi:MAG: hypothetical protein QE284_00440 [Rhizobium sp.]|nr:hypothetical protein [Rhizobium sp.]
MPNLTTSRGVSIAEPLELRLTRDLLAEHRIPLLCRSRQCRRSRTCCGPASLAPQPVALVEWLPPCRTGAAPAARREAMSLAAEIAACVPRNGTPQTWPEDKTAATRLRVLLAILHRIHSRPGPHLDSEIAGLAAWQATDPDPAESALYRRIIRHRKPAKRSAATAETPA